MGSVRPSQAADTLSTLVSRLGGRERIPCQCHPSRKSYSARYSTPGYLDEREGEIAADETRGVAADVGNLAGLDYPKQK
jgi:hypothetical protein